MQNNTLARLVIIVGFILGMTGTAGAMKGSELKVEQYGQFIEAVNTAMAV